LSLRKSVNCPRDELPLANCSTRLARPQRKLCHKISSSYVEQSSWCRSPSGADSVPDHCCCRGVLNLLITPKQPKTYRHKKTW